MCTTTFEGSLLSLKHDVRPLLTGRVDVVSIRVQVDQEGNILVHLECETRPLPCLLGPWGKRPRSMVIQVVRYFISTLSPFHLEHTTALAQESIEDMAVTFVRFAKDQLDSQGGALVKTMKAAYGLSSAVKIEVTNDRCASLCKKP